MRRKWMSHEWSIFWGCVFLAGATAVLLSMPEPEEPQVSMEASE